MTEPIEHPLTNHSAESMETAEVARRTKTSVPSGKNADIATLTDKEVRKPLPYAAAFLARVGVIAAVLWLLLTFVVGVYVCHTNTSYPMIKDGDLCLTFRLAAPKVGDAVVYRSEGETRFGRVVALAGDSVEISGEVLLVNGENVMIPAVYPTTAEGSSIPYPYTVPEGCMFVLHDFRSETTDSRTVGAVPLGDCQGSIFFLMRRRGI